MTVAKKRAKAELKADYVVRTGLFERMTETSFVALGQTLAEKVNAEAEALYMALPDSE